MEKYRVEIDEEGTICWFKFGTNKLHREDAPAIEFADGTKKWYQNGELHREDGPAVEYPDGDKFWFKNGKHHRLDGPAIDLKNGSKLYFINDCRITKDIFDFCKTKLSKKQFAEMLNLNWDWAIE